MKKRSFDMRTFRCPECGGTAKAAKRADRRTGPGHIKTMWCPWCRDMRDMVQIEDGAGYAPGRPQNVPGLIVRWDAPDYTDGAEGTKNG